jgi:hypothetical protein
MDYAGWSLVKPMIVILSSRQVWEGSAETELFLISRNPDPLFSFSGFLPTVSHAGYEFDEKMYRLLLADAKEKRMEINRNSCPPCQPVPPVYPFNAPIVEIVVYRGEDTGKTCEAGTCSKVKSGGDCGSCSE